MPPADHADFRRIKTKKIFCGYLRKLQEIFFNVRQGKQ